MSGSGYRHFEIEDSDGQVLCRKCFELYAYPRDLPARDEEGHTHCECCGESLAEPIYEPPIEGDVPPHKERD